jgi:hypothetical protein
MISSAKPIAFAAARFRFPRVVKPREVEMANRQQRSNREAKKPKKDKIKVAAAAPSQKGAGWQPTQSSETKK